MKRKFSITFPLLILELKVLITIITTFDVLPKTLHRTAGYRKIFAPMELL